MIQVLAQTLQAASGPVPPSPPPAPPFDYGLWVPTGSELLWGSLIAAGVVVAAITLLVIFRGFLTRTRLCAAYIVAAVALAPYLAIWMAKTARMWDAADPVGWWLHRVFATAMLFVGLRLFDRLVIIPLLTHGGKVPLVRFIHQIINIVLALFVVVIFGSIAFGWDIDRFLAGSAVVSIVLGLALQESLGNFFSGLVMQASPPFSVGQRITCAGHEGEVVDMTWRAVTLYTDDDNYVLIPNATVAKSEIVNYNAPSRATARFARVGLEYDLPPGEAIAVLKAAALESPGVLHKPEPVIYLEKFADSAIEYAIKFWIEDAGEHEIITHRVHMHVWYRLRERGFSIPFPIRTVEHTSHARKSREALQTAARRYLNAIEHVPLLQPLSAEQKRQLAESANDVLLGEGQTLFHQNDTGDSFYIISRGQVEVLVTPEGMTESRQVAVLGPGDFFGEMSALTGQPRSATIRAVCPLVLVQIEKQDLLPIFQADPVLMEKISEIVARRNAERQAVLQGASASPAAEAVAQQQRSLLSRMISFFRLGHAA